MADTINTLINGIENSKSDIADAIENKGVTVPSGTKLGGMATLINQIPTMHGPVSSTDGNLAAFDGTDGDTLKDSGISMSNVVTSVNNTAPVNGNVSLTIDNNNQKIKTSSVTFGNDDVVQFDGGGNITITGNATNKTMTLGVASGYSIPSTTNQTSWTNKYSKPSGGIPDSDLASTYVKTVNSIAPVNGNVTISIPAEVTESTVSGWGFTKNTGTVTGSSLTASKVVVGNGSSAIKVSTYEPSSSSTTWNASSDVYLPTMKAISNYVTGLGYTSNTGTVIGSGLTSGYFVVGAGTVNVSISSMKPTSSGTTWNTDSDVNVPTMKAISSYVTGLGYGTYSKPSGGIPSTDLAESYYLASNPNGYTTNTGTVIGSSLTAEYFVVGNGTVNVKVSSMKPTTSSTTWSTSSDVNVPTMKAISNYVTGLGYQTTDTKNTAGSTNDASHLLYVVGAQSQGANPQTYSRSNTYINANGYLVNTAGFSSKSGASSTYAYLQVSDNTLIYAANTSNGYGSLNLGLRSGNVYVSGTGTSNYPLNCYLLFPNVGSSASPKTLATTDDLVEIEDLR